METVLCSVPVETPGFKLRRKRSEGPKAMMPKIAITSLNHWTEKSGYPSCKFYDVDMLYPSDEDVERYFKKNKADIVGLSAVVSTSYMQVKRLARLIKNANKNCLVVCGGYLTAAANTVLKKTQVDVCVVGDGEVAWVGILKFMQEHLETGKNKFNIDRLLKVKGIAILDDEKNLRFSGYGLPLQSCHMTFPSFKYLKTGLLGDDEALQNYFRPFDKHEDFVMDERSYEKGRRPLVASIYLSKGCVAKCTFCQRSNKGYRVYDLSKLEKHLINLRDNYNVGFLEVDDENFGSNIKYAYEAAALLNKYDMLWNAAGVRVRSFTKEDLIYLKNNGLCSIKFGIESGSQTMLDVMEKKFTVEDIKRVQFACVDIGLYSPWQGFMLGMPGETLKTIRDSGKLMGELAAKIRVPVETIFGNIDLPYTIPLVGTPMYEYGKGLGLIGQNIDEEEKYLEVTSNVSIHKRYYLNFNGAPMSEVVFWDMLIFLEASRTYEKLMKGKKVDEKAEEKFKHLLRVQGFNPQLRRKQKKINIMGAAGILDDLKVNLYFVTNFLKQHVLFNKVIAKLPRFVVDPIVRYAVYFEFLLQKNVFKDEHNLFGIANAKVKSDIRLKDEEVDPLKTTQKERSLRTIVERKFKHLGKTKQEKTVSILTSGY